MAKHKKLWIAWEDDGSIRSKVLSREMNAAFYTFTRFERNKRLFFLRYPAAVLQTFFTLAKEKPQVLVVQNPSIVLAFFSALIKPLFNYQFVIDLHTLYINPTGIKKIVMDFLNDYSLKRGDIIIVTNDAYKAKVKEKTNQEIFVLPDKIPDFDFEFRQTPLKGKHNILFICTFSPDEPWNEVIEAAKELDKDTCIYISGRNALDQASLPSNVVLTGFIPTEAYQNLVRSVDGVIVLTTKENCLVCGGYEAVSAEKPLILSDTKVLREYFSDGTVFTQNTREDIVTSVRLLIEKYAALKEDIRKLKALRNAEWKKRWDNLMKKLVHGE